MKLAILGASGHGKVVADTAQSCGWQAIEFFDDAWPDVRSNSHWSVAGGFTCLLDRIEDFDGFVVAIGNNKIRHDKLAELMARGARLATLVHRAAIVSQYASIGEGSVVFAGAVINADARIGSGAIVNTGCSIDHDCRIGDSVHISPGARLAGNVRVGNLTWVGVGASVRQQIDIGERVIIGAGAAVVSNIPSDLTVAGVPAKRMR